MPKAKETTHVSVQLTLAEKQILDDAAEAAGKNRNRFIRDWIATLWKPKT